MANKGRRDVVIPYAPRPVQQQIQNAMESNRFCVVVAHRRLGKTVCTIIHLILRALCCPLPRGRYAYIAPERNQAKDIAWDYLKHFTAPFGSHRQVNETDLWVKLPNGARIRLYGADNPDALRGRYLDGAVIDEVAQMKPTVWGEVIRPALSDRRGWCVFIGTPKGRNIFYELYQQSLRTPGWSGGVWRVDQTKVIPEDELEAIRLELSDNQYRQEYLCDFTASADDVLIPIDLADAASRRVLTERDIAGEAEIIGVDVARFGDDKTVVTRRKGLLAHKQEVFQGLRNDEVADRVANLANRIHPDAIFVDVGGPGAGVADILTRWQFPVTGVDFGSSPQDPKVYFNKRAEMWGRLKSWLERGGCIPDAPDLKTDLSAPQFSFDEKSRIKLESKKLIKERTGRSPDYGDSLALTFAYDVRPQVAGGGSQVVTVPSLYSRGRR